MRSAAFSPSIRVAALVLPEVRLGKAEASATRSPRTPRTRRFASSTALCSSAPMAHVPLAWNTEPARARKSSSTACSDVTAAPGWRSLSVTAASGADAAMRRRTRAPSNTSCTSSALDSELGLIARADVHRAPARGPAGVERHEKARPGVRVHKPPPRAKGRGAVTRRVEIDMQVGALEVLAAAHECAGLIDAHGERSTARERVLQPRLELAVPRSQFIVQSRHARAIEIRHRDV